MDALRSERCRFCCWWENSAAAASTAEDRAGLGREEEAGGDADVEREEPSTVAKSLFNMGVRDAARHEFGDAMVGRLGPAALVIVIVIAIANVNENG